MTIDRNVKEVVGILAVLLLAFLIVAAWNPFSGPWETELESRSRTGNTVVTVMSRSVLHEGEVRAEIATSASRFELMAAGIFHSYSEVFWCKNDEAVYLLVCSGRNPHVRGFSVANWRTVDEQYSEAALNRLIAETYKLQSEFLASDFQAAGWLCEDKIR